MTTTTGGVAILLGVKKGTRRAVVALAAAVLVGSLFLRAWVLDLYPYRLPTIAGTAKLPACLIQVCARREGLQFHVRKDRWQQLWSVQTGRDACRSDGVFEDDFVANILGLVLAVLTTTAHHGDYSVPPHVTVILPYWLLIAGSGVALLLLTRLAATLSRYRPWSRLAKASAALVVLAFAMLNLVPRFLWTGHMSWQLFLLTFESRSNDDVAIAYGFPFRFCVRLMDWHGSQAHWTPYHAMENVCIALFAAGLVGIVVQHLHKGPLQPGHCARCGYDLRATPDRCPECGEPAAPNCSW